MIFRATLNLYVEAPIECMAMEKIADLLNGYDWDYHTNHHKPKPATPEQMAHLAVLRRDFYPAPATPVQALSVESNGASPHRLTHGNVQGNLFSDGSYEELT